MGNRLHLALVVGLAAFGSSACDTAEDPGIEPRLSVIQTEIFTPKCALASCHSTTFRGGELILEDGMSHSELVLAESIHEGAVAQGLPRVVPGDPDGSFLWIKLQAPLDATYGDLMPQGGTGLPDEDLTAIQTWIENGAAND
jgi:hypothetical protein